MIRKQTKFVDSSVIQASKVAFSKARRLEKDLMNWASDFSLCPEFPMPLNEVRRVFERARTTGYRPSDLDFKVFVEAASIAHRMESSLQVEYHQAYESNPLILRIKFYNKNNRKEFLEWSMSFDSMGRIYRAGTTKYGGSSQRASLHSTFDTL